MLLAAGLLPFICSLFQVSTLSLFHHLIQHTAWSPDALDGRALTGGALTIPLLSLPGVRVLTLPPFDSGCRWWALAVGVLAHLIASMMLRVPAVSVSAYR